MLCGCSQSGVSAVRSSAPTRAVTHARCYWQMSLVAVATTSAAPSIIRRRQCKHGARCQPHADNYSSLLRPVAGTLPTVLAQCGTERLVNALLTVQSRIKTGAVDAATIGPFEKSNRPAACFGCDFCGWYKFGKTTETVATSCHILKLKCTEFDFSRGSAPDPTVEAYSPPREPPSWI